MSSSPPPPSSSLDPSVLLPSSIRTCAAAIAASTALPGGGDKAAADWHFYSSFADFRHVMSAERSQLVTMLKSLLEWNGLRWGGLDLEKASPEDLCELLTEINDEMLERAATTTDEAAGVRKTYDSKDGQGGGQLLLQVKTKQTKLLSGSWNQRKNPAVRESPGAEDVSLVTARVVMRPQLGFKDLIDNSPSSPFMPRLKIKPNARKPMSVLPEYDEDGVTIEAYTHPYLHELEVFRPLQTQLERSSVSELKIIPTDEANFVFVDSKQVLSNMIDHLKGETLIAVDLEAHWYRSYQGFTCLIQISSFDTDYIIDPFPLWRDLTCLNEIFTDPKIVKVFHGADSDLVWLQRDFSVYVVNLFDTHQAAIRLNFPSGTRGYKSILLHYCQVETDKRFQLSDWRVRPLPDGMLEYARTDTRYLLHIYARMRDELLDLGSGGAGGENVLRATIDDCNRMCMTRYKKPPKIDSESHMNMVRLSRSNFNSRQMKAMKDVFAWRDKVARTEDESPEFVLPKHMLLKITTELPREMQGILACCNPIPPLVRQNLQSLHLLILKARESPLESVPADNDIEHARHQAQLNLIRNHQRLLHSDLMENPLGTTLDLSRVANLEKVNKSSVTKSIQKLSLKEEPDLSLFDYWYNTGVSCQSKRNKSSKKEICEVKCSFLSPYLRYKMLKPYLKHVKEQEGEDGRSSKSDQHSEQIKQIREHFDALTAMTPAELAGEAVERKAKEVAEAEEVEMANEEDDGEEEEEIDAGPVRPLRGGAGAGFAAKRKKDTKRNKGGTKKRQKQDDDVQSETVGAINYENADFGQFKKKKNKGKGNAYDPWKGFDAKGKQGGGGRGKKAQKFKSGRSMSYK